MPDGPERDGMGLSAVRTLVRPTAGEVAEHCQLAVHLVHASLRALVTGGQIAKTETARGQEYALVSPGAVRPFKRTKTGSAATEARVLPVPLPPSAAPSADVPLAAAR